MGVDGEKVRHVSAQAVQADKLTHQYAHTLKKNIYTKKFFAAAGDGNIDKGASSKNSNIIRALTCARVFAPT
jgi:hypothetical protein